MGLLLDRKANIEFALAENDRTALHIAAKEGHLAAVQLLLSRKANVDAMTKDQRTPLHFAVRYLGIVKALLDAGAYVMALDKVCSTNIKCETI
jgi:ankyrin repeat protein